MSYDEKIVTRTGEADVTAVQPIPPPPPIAPGQPGYQDPRMRPGYVDPAYAVPATRATEYVAERKVQRKVSSGETVRRAIVLIFGLIQGLIVARFILLLLAARESNGLVATIYDITEVLVSPFRGILGIEALEAGRSALDIGAIVALIGWTIIEVVILAVLGVMRREPQ